MKRSHALMLRAMIEKAAASLADEDALEAVELFAKWEVGVRYRKNTRVSYKDTLYKCLQIHNSQSDWTPDVAVSLWCKVEKPEQGDTPDNPIPWEWGLELVKNKYYCDKNIVYICIRNSEIGIYADLENLVGNYVEVY